MRIIVFTGKGGVGKTSVAAATALRVAGAGARTLIMSTDPAHSLADSFEAEIGGEPTELAPNLFGLQVDAQSRLEEQWDAIQDYVTKFLSWAGADPLAAEEITVLPGVDEIISLADLKNHAAEGRFDCIVVDCAPTAETLRLLSLPETTRWYMERVFPVERRIAKVVRPVMQRVSSMPAPGDDFFQALEGMYRNLEEIGRVLTDQAASSVRLVVNPEKMVIAEAQRTFTYLSLFGYRVDAVVVNRLLPDTVSDPYFEKWKRIQAAHMQTIHDSFDPVPILRAPLYDEEMLGQPMLAKLAEQVYGEADAAAVLHDDDPMTVAKTGDDYVLALRLQHTDERVDLKRKGDELIVTVGPYRRCIVLPQALGRRRVVDAAFDGPRLVVRFAKEQ